MCGIWGQVSKNQWDGLAKFKFEILGVENDARGGDSCGIAYDNCVNKGINPKKFDEFWRMDKVPDTLEYNAIIGHDRKASIGAQTFENAQPIFFEGLNVILAHNGTIYNYEDMYKAHKIKDHFDYNITGMSDSQVMGLLMEKSGWSVLNEYVGTMAFLYMRGDEPGVIYAYHGKSKLRKFSQAETEERPLYYATEDGRTWLCSTRAALEKIIKTKALIEELPFNKVFRFDGDTMTEVFTVKRDEQTQFEETTVTTNYKYAKDWREEARYYEDHSTNVEKHNKKWTKWMKNGETITRFEQDAFLNYSPNHLYYECGYFKLNGKKADGLYCCANTGRILTDTDEYAGLDYNFYFWEGNLCDDEEAYFEIMRIASTRDYQESTNTRKLWMIGKYFSHPFLVEQPHATFMYSNVPSNAGSCINLFSGTIAIPFSSKLYKIDQGRLEGIFIDEYCGIALISKSHVMTPDTSKLEELQTSLAYAMYASTEPEEELRYDCPICLGYGSLRTDNDGEEVCSACKGEGNLTPAMLEKYLSDTEDIGDLIKRLGVEHDEEKVLSMINKILDIGLDILEEKSAFQSEELINKITEIKLTLWAK